MTQVPTGVLDSAHASVTAVRQHTVVGAGGSVHLGTSRLKPGTRVEVIVLTEPETEATAGAKSLMDFYGAARPCHGSLEEIDGFIRQERDRWD